MIALIVLAVVGGLAAWTAVLLLIVVPVLPRLRRWLHTSDPVSRTPRGTGVGVLALGVLVAIVIAVATRGQVITWDGVLTVGVPS